MAKEAACLQGKVRLMMSAERGDGTEFYQEFCSGKEHPYAYRNTKKNR